MTPGKDPRFGVHSNLKETHQKGRAGFVCPIPFPVAGNQAAYRGKSERNMTQAYLL